MARGVKRTGPSEPQSNGKKSRATKKRESQYRSSSPVFGEGDGDEGKEGDEEEEENPMVGIQTLDTITTQVNALKDQQARQEDWPKQFGKKLDDKEAETLKMLNEIKTKLENDKSHFESRLIHVFEAALGPIDDCEATDVIEEPLVHVPFPTTSNQAFFKNLSSLIEACHVLTSTYHTLANAPPRQSNIPKLESDLQLDKVAITKSIAAGRKLVQRDVEGSLADVRHEIRGRSNLTTDDEARGRQLMMRAKKEDQRCAAPQGVGFGETALALEKVAKKMDMVGRRERRER